MAPRNTLGDYLATLPAATIDNDDLIYAIVDGQEAVITADQVFGGGGGGVGVTDGDKGDVVVSGGGATWSIEANAIATTKIANGAVTAAKLNADTKATEAQAKAGTDDTAYLTSAKARASLPYSILHPSGDTAGTTDTAALNALSVPRQVRLAPGTFHLLNATIRTGLHIEGSGRGVTAVKVPNSSNGQAFLTENWVTLTGTDTNSGPTGWSIKNLTIDANGANNAGGSWGMLIYGSDFELENLDIINARTGGIQSEWSTTSGPNHMEARVRNVFTHTPYAALGIQWNGPHDSHFDTVSIVSTVATAGAGQRGFYFGPKALGTRLVNCHAWGTSQWAAEVAGVAVWFTQCYLEGGQVGQLLIAEDGCQYRGGWIGGNAATGVKGIELGVAAGTAATTADIDTAVYYARGGALNLVNQVSNKVRLHVVRDTVDPVVIGSSTATDWSDISIQVEGTAGADEYEQIRRRAIFHNRSTAAQPVLITKGHSSQSAAMASFRTHADVEVASVTLTGGFRPLQVATGSRPTAASAGAGAMIYDTTLSKPIWSNGTVWKDAAGTTV
jgi:hypothetical protein